MRRLLLPAALFLTPMACEAIVAAVVVALASLLAPSEVADCTTTDEVVQLDVATGGIVPGDVIDTLGTRSTATTWADDEDQAVRATVTIRTDATEAEGYSDAGCDDVVGIPVTVELSTDDGRLDETWQGTGRITPVGDTSWALVVDQVVAPGDLGGSVTLAEPDEGETVVGLGIHLRWLPDGVAAGLRTDFEDAGGAVRHEGLGFLGGDDVDEGEGL